MEPRFPPIPAVYGFLAVGGRVLLLRREGTGYGAGLLCLPAGHLERGEDLIRCLQREMREELGIKIARNDTQLSLVMHRAPEFPGDVESLDFVFRILAWDGEPSIMEPGKCSELRWVDPAHLPADIVPHVRPAIQAVLDGTRLLTIGYADG